MSVKTKNITFSLPVELIEKFKSCVKENYIISMNNAVKKAMEDYLKKIEKEKLYKEMLEASKDPLFMRDLEDSMKAFEISDSEMEVLTEW